MASIKPCHQAACLGSACLCPRRLDSNSRPKKLLKNISQQLRRWRAYHRSSTRAGAFENPAITLEVYSHWFKDAATGAVDRFAQGFGKPEEMWAKSGH
jgi:hypothetical protein